MVTHQNTAQCVTADETLEQEYGFRPLTEGEKQEFMNSLDANGKRILAELMGKTKGSNHLRSASAKKTSKVISTTPNSSAEELAV